MKTKLMYYRDKTTANTTKEVCYEAFTLFDLFSQTDKIEVDIDSNINVNLGKTANDKMNSYGFLSRTLFSTYAFGSLGFANAITATAIVASVNYGKNRIFIGNKIRIEVYRFSHLPQANYYYCTAFANTSNGVKTFDFCLTASYNDKTAENRQKKNNNRKCNNTRGFIPLIKTEENYQMRFCENVFIGDFDAFAFNVEY